MILRVLVTVTLIFVNLAFGLNENRCKFPHHKNFETALNLLQRSNVLGRNYTVSAEGYNYTVGICVDVNGNEDDKSKCDAATQVKGDTVHVLGRCNNSDVHFGSDWAMIQYEDGESAHDDGELTFYDEDVDERSSSCYYMFEIDTPHICQYNCSAQPTTPLPITTPALVPAEVHGLSAGSIFLIVFFSVSAAYLIVGFLVKFCTGHYGLELIPNVYMWMSFFNLVADGCDFCFRCGPYADNSRSLRIEGDFGGETGFGSGRGASMSSSQRRGPLTPPPSALPPATPSLSEASSSYQQFNSLNKNQRPISTTGSLTGEAGSLASATNDDTYLIQA